MSVPFSYLTNTAWEKFVEKHDDFMQNSKTKIDNEKRNTKLYFHKKWWFWKEFRIFSLSLYHFMSLTLFYLFSTTAGPPSAYPFWIGLSVHRVARPPELILRQMGQSPDVAHNAWQRPYYQRSLTYSHALHATLCATSHGRIRSIVVELRHDPTWSRMP